MPAKPSPPLITLLTDFGQKDHFVGVMKGVIASIAPAARIIDITHEVEPYAVAQSQFLLAQSWPYFPKGTIHVAIVDPGASDARFSCRFTAICSSAPTTACSATCSKFPGQ